MNNNKTHKVTEPKELKEPKNEAVSPLRRRYRTLLPKSTKQTCLSESSQINVRSIIKAPLNQALQKTKTFPMKPIVILINRT